MYPLPNEMIFNFHLKKYVQGQNFLEYQKKK